MELILRDLVIRHKRRFQILFPHQKTIEGWRWWGTGVLSISLMEQGVIHISTTMMVALIKWKNQEINSILVVSCQAVIIRSTSKKKNILISTASLFNTTKMDPAEIPMLFKVTEDWRLRQPKERNTEWLSKILSEAGTKSHSIWSKEVVDKPLLNRKVQDVKNNKHKTSVIPTSAHWIQLLINQPSSTDLEIKPNWFQQLIFSHQTSLMVAKMSHETLKAETISSPTQALKQSVEVTTWENHCMWEIKIEITFVIKEQQMLLSSSITQIMELSVIFQDMLENLIIA